MSDIGGCPLPSRVQTRNLLIFAGCFWMQYLSAPVSYVTNQGILCNKLDAGDLVSNLPSTMYFGTSFLALIVAWCFPYVSYLRRNAVSCFSIQAVALAAVATALVSPIPNAIKIAVIIVQCAVSGVVILAATAFLWEAIGRGVAESRRGIILSLTFGAGPLLAVLGSLVSQGILPVEADKRFSFVPDFPGNFALMYALCVPMTLMCALAASRLVIPLPEQELPREPFFRGVFGGVVNYLRDRVLFVSLVVVTLVYTGNLIMANMSLYTAQAMHTDVTTYAGWQAVLRFGGKAVGGLLLGWLLYLTSPRAGLLTTSVFFLVCQVWTFTATGFWYLPAFALFGIGELIGVYGPNYVLSASRPADIRRNMALANCFNALAAPANPLFGAIAEHFNQSQPGAGYRASFAVCAAFIGAGILLALVALPARPQPKTAV